MVAKYKESLLMDWFLLCLVALFASGIQGLTGFGFGLIVVPSFLIILNDASAIQLVILITIVMSAAIWPFFRGRVPMAIHNRLVIGSLLGFPFGAGAFLVLDLNAIKIATAIVVLLVTCQTIWERLKHKNTMMESLPKLEYVIGLAAGFLATAVAIPGPVIMLYLTRTQLSKDEIRAIILTFFVFVHIGALISQIVFVGIAQHTWILAAVLCVPSVVGIVGGHYLSRFVSQSLFKTINLVILLVTGSSILFNVLY